MVVQSIVLITAMLFFSGCSPDGPLLKRLTRSGRFFGSEVRVDVCYDVSRGSALRGAMDAVWARFADIHSRLSVYDPGSDLNRINRSFPRPVVVGADTWAILQHAVDYYRISGGEFDVTIYPLLMLWKDAEQSGHVPSQDQVRLARQAMGMSRFELLPGNQVRLLNPLTKLTIDSIADGYAADEAARLLRARGFDDFLIDTSGEIYASGPGCRGKPWRVGIRDPFGRPGTVLADRLELHDAAVTTSGNYEHFYVVGGKRYSHIISPVTGAPRDDIVSVTVIAPDTEFSDFLSTALCLMDPAKGIELIDRLGDKVAAVILVDDGAGHLTRMTSRHYARYLAGGGRGLN